MMILLVPFSYLFLAIQFSVSKENDMKVYLLLRVLNLIIKITGLFLEAEWRKTVSRAQP